MTALVVLLIIFFCCFFLKSPDHKKIQPARRIIFNPNKKGPRPPIILITVDTLRADHLTCYGYQRNTSPHLDQFAREALIFNNCFSHAPVTSSSMASILSGFLPHETKVLKNLPLPKPVQILPELLASLDYHSVAVVSNFVLRRKAGWSNGFTVFDDTMTSHESIRRNPERVAKETTDRAIELLKQNYQSRLFFWVHYQDPHGPYEPPPAFAGLFQDPGEKPLNLAIKNSLSGRGGIPLYQKLKNHRDYNYYVAQYDGEIRYFDENIHRLFNTLKDLDLYDNALIIFTSDHGEGMGEHDYFFAHGENLYASLTHVPLIIRYGDKLIGKRTDFVQHIDIVPTILSALGQQIPKAFRGRDLRNQHNEKVEIFAEMESSLAQQDKIKYSIIYDGLKLIFTPSFMEYLLYDLRSDIHETIDLSSYQDYKPKLNDLKTRLDRLRLEDNLNLDIINMPIKVSKDERAKLKSLGYVQ